MDGLVCFQGRLFADPVKPSWCITGPRGPLGSTNQNSGCVPNCCQWPSRSILWFVYIPVVCWEHGATVCTLMAVFARRGLATHPHRPTPPPSHPPTAPPHPTPPHPSPHPTPLPPAHHPTPPPSHPLTAPPHPPPTRPPPHPTPLPPAHRPTPPPSHPPTAPPHPPPTHPPPINAIRDITGPVKKLSQKPALNTARQSYL